ncbi:MAG: RHS repeat-associated core domain-containing protein, partial [Clostridia bacterium]|nr:RHS repeat-associated core domain-containing protein [Clostridia bacterium]
NTVVVLTPAVHELKAEIINGANKSVTVSEVKLHYYSNVKDSDVISYGDGIGSNWQEVGKITLQLGETSIENVDFTFNDYLQTAISVMKHPNSFNLWYNKGKNLISGCNSTTVKFCFNGVILEFDEFKYAKKQENSVETQIVYLNYWTSSYAEWIINRTRGNETKTKKVRIDNYLKLLTETEDGISDNYYYDNYGNCTKVKSIGGTDSSCNIQSEWGYTNGDRLTSEKTFKNLLEYTTQYTHNSYGNVTKTILPNGQNINYTYTPNGELLTDVHTTLSGTELKNSLGYLENNLSSIKSLNNPEYQFLYDKFNNLKKVERSNKTLFETNTHYNADKSGYVETKNADGVIKRQYFDKYGHVYKVVKVENGNEIDILWLFYGDNDSVLSASVPNDYEHYKISKNSKLYQIVDKTDDVSYNAIYYYDDLGNITYIDYYCKSFTNTIAERDEYNRPKFVESIAVYDGQSTAYTYSNAFSNELASEKALLINDLQNVYHLETTYQKDSLNRLVSTTVKDDGNNGYKQEITYCTRDKKVLSGGDITPIAPFALKPIYKVVTDGTTPYISEVKTYNYNNGSLTQIQTDAVTQNANGNITKYGNNSYIYDDINRLIRENNADLGKTFVYEYDAHGNILSKKEYAYTIGLIGEVLATTTYSYDEYDKLVAINGVEVTYNNAGKPLSYNGKTFTWEDGKLKSVNCGGNKTVTFKRDIGGLESTKTVVDNNVTKQYPKIYENNILKFEYETAPGASNYTRIIYLYNSQGVIGFQYNNDIYAYRKNLFGDITEIYSGATCVAKYKYDAWGNCTVCNPDGTVNTSADFIGNINPFRYRGYYWDRDLGLYHLQTRYYDPAIGRFISLDSYEYLDPEFFGGLNLYCYCINNPVNYKQRPVSSGCSVTSSSISVGGSTGIGGSSGASDSVSNGSAPWYAQTIVGALPDLYSGAPYLMAKGMHKYFAYKKNYYYMFPILGETHKRLAIHSTSFWKLSNATFRELVTGNAKASIGSVIGSIAGVGFFTFGTNLLFNLHENGFDLTDKAMWIDTGIDTAIGMGAYGLAMGTASLATAGLAMAGVALPGIVVIGGVIVLSIGFDHLIRA